MPWLTAVGSAPHLVFFGGGSFLQLFPLRGLTSENWEQLTIVGKFIDYIWHLFLPLLCLVLGSFAVLTILTKNTMLEEIRKQYVLTARSKGLTEKIVLWKHVLRNALIPIITGFPAAFVGAFFTGALLIETLLLEKILVIFDNIPGLSITSNRK